MTASAGPVLKRLYAEFGKRVAFVTLYVREAHPGEHYPQASTFARKLQHARDYKQRDAIPWPVAVDDLEGSLHQVLDAKPNAAYVMDVGGQVAFRTLWSNDESVLRQGLRAMTADARSPIGERQPRLVPMLGGLGEMDSILDLAGRQAKRDVWRAMPPPYGLARLAALFRPLPPHQRGLAATATGLLGVVVLGGLGWTLFNRHRR